MFQVSMSILWLAVQANMSRMSGYIREGELDMILIRPVSAQFYVTLRWVKPAEVFMVLAGLAVTAIGLSQAGRSPDLTDLAQAAALLACGAVLLTCVWSAFVYLAFWFTSVEPIPMVVQDVMGAGRYPLAFYPAAVRVLLGFVFPVGFASTFPVEALAGRASWWLVPAGIVLSGVALWLLRAYWRYAVRFYSSASS
jgi:ABC-2 type transport system permease protein